MPSRSLGGDGNTIRLATDGQSAGPGGVGPGQKYGERIEAGEVPQSVPQEGGVGDASDAHRPR